MMNPNTVAGDMASSVRAVEELLNYTFNNKILLEVALTHPSFTDSPSYQRLEFVGDAALGLAISNYVFQAYPELDPGQLTPLRAANVSTEKLARVAVRHRFFRYIRHNAPALDDKVREFVLTVEKEEETVVHGGPMKAPKILADIVESVAAAVYIDCNFDLEALWVIFRGLLDPIVMPDMLQQQPQPVTTLYEWCQKQGKHVEIRHRREGEKSIASVYIDDIFIESSYSEQKENAKLRAAGAALLKLSTIPKTSERIPISNCNQLSGTNFEGAKQKLREACEKMKWPKPSYRIKREGRRETIPSTYHAATPANLKIIDLYKMFAALTALIQVVYMAIVGSFPFNYFLSGVLSCVGTAVVVCLRFQVNKEFKDLPPKRAFADFVLCNLVLHLVIMNVLG